MSQEIERAASSKTLWKNGLKIWRLDESTHGVTSKHKYLEKGQDQDSSKKARASAEFQSITSLS